MDKDFHTSPGTTPRRFQTYRKDPDRWAAWLRRMSLLVGINSIPGTIPQIPLAAHTCPSLQFPFSSCRKLPLPFRGQSILVGPFPLVEFPDEVLNIVSGDSFHWAVVATAPREGSTFFYGCFSDGIFSQSCCRLPLNFRHSFKPESL